MTSMIGQPTSCMVAIDDVPGRALSIRSEDIPHQGDLGRQCQPADRRFVIEMSRVDTADDRWTVSASVSRVEPGSALGRTETIYLNGDYHPTDRDRLQADIGGILKSAPHLDVTVQCPSFDDELGSFTLSVIQAMPNRIFLELSRAQNLSDQTASPQLWLDRCLTRGGLWRKRSLDLLLSVAAIIVLAPLMALIAVLIRLTSSGPVLFRQPRYGQAGVPFEILKFRTMEQSRSDVFGRALTVERDPRVTRIGRLLRRTSLDELPQLINVLKGDMSLVGPRPHALAAVAGALPYTDCHQHYAQRYRVLPGITGLAQVNGKRGPTPTTESLIERLQLDLDYTARWSLGLDLKILARTVMVLVGDKNAV